MSITLLTCTISSLPLLVRYKEVIGSFFTYAQQDPEHSQYYVQYGNMLLEEAKAMRESQKVPPPLPAKPQNSTPYSSYEAPRSYDYPSQSFSPSPYPGADARNPQPTTSAFPPVDPQRQDSQLTMSDVYQAAAGVGNKLKQIDNDYHVTQTCKNVATACVNKAKELDKEYEVYFVEDSKFLDSPESCSNGTSNQSLGWTKWCFESNREWSPSSCRTSNNSNQGNGRSK